jgi:hypothetical protein
VFDDRASLKLSDCGRDVYLLTPGGIALARVDAVRCRNQSGAVRLEFRDEAREMVQASS